MGTQACQLIHHADEQDPSNKLVAHVGNTSHRIRFRTVELRPVSAPAPPPPPPAYPGGKGSGKGGGRNKSQKKLREEAWQLQQTTDEMTGAVQLRERPRRRGGRRRAVEIAVQESDDEAGPSSMVIAGPTPGPSRLAGQDALIRPRPGEAATATEGALGVDVRGASEVQPQDAAVDDDHMEVDEV
jgi:hypothetical protein